MTTKFVRIVVSDCEHVDEAELAEFDLERWKQEKVEEQRIKIIKTNGTILHISLGLLLLCLMVVCLSIASLYVSPLCVDHGSSNWISLQYFLFYDSFFLGFCLLATITLVILANLLYPMLLHSGIELYFLNLCRYAEYTIKFAQFCGSLALFGMFAIQVVECIIYGKLFISTDSVCPLPVATMTIVMNLLFFGGPLLVFCCVALGRTSALNFSDEELEAEGEGDGDGEGEGEEGEEVALVLQAQPLMVDEEHV